MSHLAVVLPWNWVHNHWACCLPGPAFIKLLLRLLAPLLILCWRWHSTWTNKNSSPILSVLPHLQALLLEKEPRFVLVLLKCQKGVKHAWQPLASKISPELCLFTDSHEGILEPLHHSLRALIINRDENQEIRATLSLPNKHNPVALHLVGLLHIYEILQKTPQ